MKFHLNEYPEYLPEIDAMSTDELLSAVLCPDIPIGKRDLTRKTQSIFFHPTTVEIAVGAAKEVNDGRELPALIASDMEYGPGRAVVGSTNFPSMRAAAESGDENLAYQMGVSAALEGRASGYHWTFAPCVDILGNRDNPIVSIRCPGEDADTVIRYGGAYMRGIQDNGMIATLKHFPGDGYCINDQHITVANNPLSREDWDATFGRVYGELIEQGAMSIMPGHITLASYDEIDPETGLYPPASVSKNLLTGLLRERFGFEGIIVSDATNMTGFCGYINRFRAAARFLEAGGDSLLFMHDNEEYHTEMNKMLEEGVLTLKTLKNRVWRMMCFRRQYFDSLAHLPSPTPDRVAIEALSAEMVDKSVKIHRDRKGLLPFAITKDTRIAHYVIYNSNTTDMTPAKELTEKLSALSDHVEEFIDVGPGTSLKIAKSGNYDLIICSVLTDFAWGTNMIKLCGPMARNMMNGWTRYGTPSVFISYHSPYFADDYYAVVDAIINTYGYNSYTNDAVIRRILGK